MAPSKAAQTPASPFTKDERVLCFHHEMLYEAKVLDIRPTDDETTWQYKIHYKGWKNTWDDWVPQDRVRKFTEENKELAASLHAQMKLLQKAPKSAAKGKGGRANGSEFGSSRGSEERHASVAAPGGRGPRRNRDYDLEQAPSRLPLKKGSKRTYDDFEADLPKPARRSSRVPAAKAQLEDSDSTGSRKSARHGSGLGSWADPKNDEWDVIRLLYSDECLAPDPLMKMPPRNYQYIDANGKLKDPYKYHIDKPAPKPHPKLDAHIKNGSVTPANELYYKDMPHDRILPLAGITRNRRPSVDESVVRKAMAEITRNERSLVENSEVRVTKAEPTKGSRLCRFLQKIEELTWIKQLQEEGFHQRPSIKLIIPDHIKAILVDDWENVTKNQQLVPIPSAQPVNRILNDYLDFEMPKRQPGSAQADILEEVVAGLKEYFEKCLGRILLYRFERNQYLEVRELWTKGEGEWAGKGAGDTYGAEHLCRLLVSLPELIAQTNMDQQSVNRLREELAKMTNWLGKHSVNYFVKDYETPSQDYVEKARGV